MGPFTRPAGCCFVSTKWDGTHEALRVGPVLRKLSLMSAVISHPRPAARSGGPGHPTLTLLLCPPLPSLARRKPGRREPILETTGLSPAGEIPSRPAAFEQQPPCPYPFPRPAHRCCNLLAKVPPGKANISKIPSRVTHPVFSPQRLQTRPSVQAELPTPLLRPSPPRMEALPASLLPRRGQLWDYWE